MIARIIFGMYFLIFGLFVAGMFILLDLKEPHVPGHVRIPGQVNAPGRFLIPGRSNTVEIQGAIELAGGYTATADEEQVAVIRGQRRIPLNVLRMTMYDSEGFSLVPGDTVVVSGVGGVEVQ